MTSIRKSLIKGKTKDSPRGLGMFAFMKPFKLNADTWIFTSELYQTTSTVVRTEDHVLVVDPNWMPEEVAGIRAFVHEIAEHRNQVLMFTHADYDHILGYGAFEPIRVIASQAFASNIHWEKDLEEIRADDARRGSIRPYAVRYPLVTDVITGDDFRIDFGSKTLRCFLAPGHTAEGLMLLVEPDGVLIAGDYLSDIEFPLVDDLPAYRRTLTQVADLISAGAVHKVIPGHGSVAHTEREIRKRRSEALEYLNDLARYAHGRPFPESKYRQRYAEWDALVDWHRENLARMEPH